MLDKDMIRSLIRDVIAEEVRKFKLGGTEPQIGESVFVSNDADLAAFARRVLALAEEPKTRAAIKDGRFSFRLAGSTPLVPQAAAAQAVPGVQSHRIDKGVVTEAVIGKLAKDVSRLILGPGVSITPLARDKAKARNISIERVRP